MLDQIRQSSDFALLSYLLEQKKVCLRQTCGRWVQASDSLKTAELHRSYIPRTTAAALDAEHRAECMQTRAAAAQLCPRGN